MKKGKHENEALTGTMETWEQTVFDNAAVFRVTVMRGQRNHDTRDFTKFPDAVECAKANQPRVMLYAITRDERNFCIPPKQWEAYSVRWDLAVKFLLEGYDARQKGETANPYPATPWIAGMWDRGWAQADRELKP